MIDFEAEPVKVITIRTSTAVQAFREAADWVAQRHGDVEALTWLDLSTVDEQQSGFELAIYFDPARPVRSDPPPGGRLLYGVEDQRTSR